MNSFGKLRGSFFHQECVKQSYDEGLRTSLLHSANGRSAQQIVERKDTCRKAALAHFNNPKKIESIIEIAVHLVDRGFDDVRRWVWDEGIDYITQFPFMGPATSYHFAKILACR